MSSEQSGESTGERTPEGDRLFRTAMHRGLPSDYVSLGEWLLANAQGPTDQYHAVGFLQQAAEAGEARAWIL